MSTLSLVADILRAPIDPDPEPAPIIITRPIVDPEARRRADLLAFGYSQLAQCRDMDALRAVQHWFARNRQDRGRS